MQLARTFVSEVLVKAHEEASSNPVNINTFDNDVDNNTENTLLLQPKVNNSLNIIFNMLHH